MDNSSLLKQLQTNDPSSPGNSLLSLLKMWYDWRSSLGTDPNPIGLSAPANIMGAFKVPSRQGPLDLAGLMQWLQKNTDVAKYNTPAVSKAPSRFNGDFEIQVPAPKNPDQLRSHWRPAIKGEPTPGTDAVAPDVASRGDYIGKAMPGVDEDIPAYLWNMLTRAPRSIADWTER